MAHTLQLLDGTTTLDLLEAGDHRVRYGGMDTPPPMPEITYAGSRFRDGQVPAFASYPNREITVRLKVEGTTVDDLIQNYSDAAKMIAESLRYWRTGGAQGKRARLAVKLDTATNTVEYEVLAGRVLPGNWATVTPTRSFKLVDAVIELTCSPFAEENGDVTTTASNQANDGVAVTLSAERGEVETPAKITVTTDQLLDSGGRVLWLGRRTRGTVANLIHQMQCDAATPGATTSFTGYDVTELGDAPYVHVVYERTAVATSSGGNFGRWTCGVGEAALNLRLFRLAITANLPDHYGQFRLWMRCRRFTGSATITNIQAFYGTANSPTLTPGVVAGSPLNSASAFWSMLDLGVIQWPDQQLPAGVTCSTLVIEIEVDMDTNSILDVDYIRLQPIDEESIEIRFNSSIPAGYKVVMDGRSLPPVVYVTDGSDNVVTSIAIASIVGQPLTIAPGTNLLLAYFDGTAELSPGDVLADTLDLAIVRRPRYGWQRGS